MTGRIPASGPISFSSKINPVHEKGFSLSSYYRCLPDPFPADSSEPISFSSFYNTSNENFHRWVFRPENGFNQYYEVPQGVTSIKFTAIGAGGKGADGTGDWSVYKSGGGGAGATPTDGIVSTNPEYDRANIKLGSGDRVSSTVISIVSNNQSIIGAPGNSAAENSGGTSISFSGGNGTSITNAGTVISSFTYGSGPNAGNILPAVTEYKLTYGRFRLGSSGGASVYSIGATSNLQYSTNGEYGGGGAGGWSPGKIYSLKITPTTTHPIKSTAYNKTSYIVQNMASLKQVVIKAPVSNNFAYARITGVGNGATLPPNLLQQCVERGAYDTHHLITNQSTGNLGAETPTPFYDTGWLNISGSRKNIIDLPDSITNNYSTLMVELQGSWGGNSDSNATISFKNNYIIPKKVKFLPQYWTHGYWNQSWWWGYDLWYNRWNSDWYWWGYWGNYGYWDGYGYSYWNQYGWWDYYSVYTHIDNHQNWNESFFVDAEQNTNYWWNGRYYFYNWWWGSNYNWDWSWYWNGSQWDNKIPVISAENYSNFQANTGLSVYYLSYFNSWWWGWNNRSWYNNIMQQAGIIWITPTIDGFKSLPPGKYMMLGGSYQNYWQWDGWGYYYGYNSFDYWNGYYWGSWWTPQHYPFLITGGEFQEVMTLSEGKNVTLPSGFTMYNLSDDPAARIEAGKATIGGDGVAFIKEWIFEKPGNWFMTVPQDQTSLDVEITGYGGSTIQRTLTDLVNSQELSIVVGSINNKTSAIDSSYNGVQDPNFVELGGVGSNIARVVIKTKNVNYTTLKAAK